MPEALLLVDVIKDFDHADGEALLESFRNRHDGMVRGLEQARKDGIPVIYANDNEGIWDNELLALDYLERDASVEVVRARAAPRQFAS